MTPLGLFFVTLASVGNCQKMKKLFSLLHTYSLIFNCGHKNTMQCEETYFNFIIEDRMPSSQSVGAKPLGASIFLLVLFYWSCSYGINEHVEEFSCSSRSPRCLMYVASEANIKLYGIVKNELHECMKEGKELYQSITCKALVNKI